MDSKSLLRKGWLILILVCIVVVVVVRWWPWWTDCKTTIVFVIRHAEKIEPATDSTGLTETGIRRARELVRVLGNCGVQGVYTSEAERTRRTAEDLATSLGVTPTQLPLAQLGDVAGLTSRIRSTDRGKTVLVVAHSNTAPEVVLQLSGVTVPAIPDAEYDNLFVVIIPPCGPTRLHRMKYREEPAPE